jgi:hypothetical protein
LAIATHSDKSKGGGKMSDLSELPSDFSNRRVVSEYHPYCWCLRPWELPFAGQPFREYEAINDELGDFKELWILIYEQYPQPLIGLCILDFDEGAPSTQKIIDIYNELSALQRVAIETVNGRLGQLISGSGI